MVRLFLVRHGETIDNAQQVMQGQMQGQLNETGFEQARELAARLRDTHFDAIVASDLRRSIQTAEIIAETLGLTIVTTPLLRERDWGDFTGKYIPSLKGAAWPDNVETLDHLLDRARQFLDFVLTNYPDQTVVAVGHGIINKAIQAVYHNTLMRKVEKMQNCEVRILDIFEN